MENKSVLITCGPTSEQIDAVRKITNFSTGSLGIFLANYFVREGWRVTLLMGEAATCRDEPKAGAVHRFTSAHDLRGRLEELSQTLVPHPRAILQCAAVADYHVASVEAAGGEKLSGEKISGGHEEIILRLRKNPKILPELKKMYPGSIVVGWKYEMDGGIGTAVSRAEAQILEASSDACVVNGAAYGQGFGWMLRGKSPRHCARNNDLAEEIREFIERN